MTLVESTRGLRKATEEQLEAAISAAVRIKARIVERDERESGERVLLNLGHTLGPVSYTHLTLPTSDLV